MKLKLKTEGLKGDMLTFVEQLNARFAELPDGLTKEDIQTEIRTVMKALFNDDGKLFILDSIKALEEQLAEEGENSIKAILKAQGTTLTELKAAIGADKKQKSLQEMLSEKTEDFKKIVRDQSGQVILEVKAASVTSIAGPNGSITNSITTGTALRLGDGEVFEIVRGPEFVLSFVNVGSTDSPMLIWFDEVPKEGDFVITAEGELKPKLQYIFDRKSSDYKKAAGFSVLTDEFMNDLPRLVTTIRRLLQIDCRLDMNDQIWADLIAAAPTYVYTGLNGQIANPDDYAAIGAAISQVQSLFFTPNVLALNPADLWRVRLLKDNNGRYQLPPFTFNGQSYEFGKVVVDPRVALGKFLVGDGTMFNVDLKGSLIIRIGYANDDLIRNQQSVVVEQYFYDYISTNRRGGLVYGDFAAIKALIAAA